MRDGGRNYPQPMTPKRSRLVPQEEERHCGCRRHRQRRVAALGLPLRRRAPRHRTALDHALQAGTSWAAGSGPCCTGTSTRCADPARGTKPKGLSWNWQRQSPAPSFAFTVRWLLLQRRGLCLGCRLRGAARELLEQAETMLTSVLVLVHVHAFAHADSWPGVCHTCRSRVQVRLLLWCLN